MKAGVILSAILLSTALVAEDSMPPILRDAVHCMSAENFQLGKSGSSLLRLSYETGKQSASGETVMHVISYTNPERTEGLLYTMFARQQDEKNAFDIRNEAKFAKSKDGVALVGAARGDELPQQELVTAVEKIAGQPMFSMGLVDVLASQPSGACKSYKSKKHESR